jgi:hypothetical protein
MFRRPDGGPWQKSHQTCPMNDACERAKIKPPVGFGHMSKTYIDEAIRVGAPKFRITRRGNVVPITADRR